MKRLYWVILCMLCACLNVEAQQSIRTTINGVNYVTLSDTSVQVAQSNVFGDIVIPEQVKIKRKFYKVVEIAPRALAANSVGGGHQHHSIAKLFAKNRGGCLQGSSAYENRAA